MTAEDRDPVQNIYIKKVETKKMFGYDKAELWNTVIKAYPAVSQYWTYGKAKFLAQPVYSGDYPPCKFCEWIWRICLIEKAKPRPRARGFLLHAHEKLFMTKFSSAAYAIH